MYAASSNVLSGGLDVDGVLACGRGVLDRGLCIGRDVAERWDVE